MESKTWVIVFLLLATSFETLMARNERVIKLCDGSQGKKIWPELIGVPAKLANETIVKDNPIITDVQIVLNGSPVTADYRFNRVRLFVNVLDYVVQIPSVA